MPTISLTFDSTGAATAAADYERSVERIDRAALRAVESQERVNAAIRGRSASDLSQAANAQAQAVERVTAAHTRAVASTNAAVSALSAEERALKTRINTGLTALSTLGGESRAYAQLTRDSIRRAETLGQEINRTELLAQVQTRLAATAALPAQAFSTAAVNARDLRLNMQSLSNSITLLGTQFGAFGPIVAQGFAVVRQTISDARRELEAFLAAKSAATAGDAAALAARREAAGGLIGVGIGAGVLSFGLLATGAAKAASEIDNLDDTAKRLGVSLKDLQGLKVLGAATDIPDITRSFEDFEKRVGDLEDGAGRAKEAFKILNLSFEDVRKLTPIAALQAVSDAYLKLDNTTDQAAVRQKLFGVASREVDELLRLGTRGIADYIAQGGRFGSITNEQAEAAGKLHRELSVLWETTKIGLLTAFGPAAISILSGFISKAEEAASVLERIAKAVSQGINPSSPDAIRSRVGALESRQTALLQHDPGLKQPDIAEEVRRNTAELNALDAVLAQTDTAVKKTGTSIADVGARVGEFTDKTKDSTGTLAAFLSEQQRELALSQLSARDRAVQTALIEAATRARKEGVGFYAEEMAAVKRTAAAIFDANEGHREAEKATRAETKATEEAARAQAAWSEELRRGDLAQQKAIATSDQRIAAIDAENESLRRQIAAAVQGKEAVIALQAQLAGEEEELRTIRERGGPLTQPDSAAAFQRGFTHEQLTKQLTLTNSEQERIAAAYQKPFQNAAENIQRAFGDVFTRVFDRALGTAKGFWGDMLDLAKRFLAEIAVLEIFGPTFGKIGAGGSQGGGLLSLLGGGGGNGGLLGNLFGGNGGGLLSLFGGGSSLAKTTFTLAPESASLFADSVQTGAFLGTKAGGVGLVSKIGSLFTGGGGFFSNVGSALGLTGGGGLLGGALGGLALPLLGFGIGQQLGVPGVGRSLVTGGLTAVGAGLAGAYGATAIGAGASALGASVGTATAITTAVSSLAAAATVIGLVVAAIGYGYGNIVGNQSAGAQAGRFARSGDNPYAGQSITHTFNSTILSTGSPWFALAAAIGASQSEPRLGFSLATRPTGTVSDRGLSAESPFGELNLFNQTHTLRQRQSSTSFKLLGAIAEFDKAIAKLLDPSEIERVTAQLQGAGVASVYERASHFQEGINHLLRKRFAEVATALEGEAAGTQFLHHGQGKNLPQAEAAFLTAREQYHTAIDTLSGREIPSFTTQLDQLKAKFEQARAAAAPFGFDLSKLTDAFEAGRQKLGTDFADALQLRLLARTDPLAAQLLQQQKDADALIANARAIDAELGLHTIVSAEREAAADRVAIIEDFAKRANAPLEALRNSLTVGDLGGLSIPARFAAAQADFERERAQAIASPFNLTERSDATNALQTLLELGKQQFGSGQGFEDLRQQALSFISSFEGVFTGANIPTAVDVGGAAATPTTTISGPVQTVADPAVVAAEQTSATNSTAQLTATRDGNELLAKLIAAVNQLTSQQVSLNADVQRLLANQ